MSVGAHDAQSLIALRLAERLGLDETTCAVVYYVGVVSWVGCPVDAYEQATRLRDDMALKTEARQVDLAVTVARAFTRATSAPGEG